MVLLEPLLRLRRAIQHAAVCAHSDKFAGRGNELNP
jgi:hypothetical protein